MLKNDYYSQTNTLLRKWFENIDHTLREQIKKEWITDMERLHVNIPFFLWFSTFTSKHGLSIVYSQPSLKVQTTLSRIWHLVEGGSVSAIHPPAEDLKFLLEGAPILPTPFRKGQEGDSTVTCEDLKKVHQQLNYTNTAITTITTQLNHVVIRVEETKKQERVPSNTPKGSNYANSISKSFFKIESVPPKDQESFTHAFSDTLLLNQISTQIKALDLQTISTSCLDKTCVLAKVETSTSEEEEEDDLGDSEEASLNVISKLFEEDSPLAINKIRHWNSNARRNFFPNQLLQTFNMKNEEPLLQMLLTVNPFTPGT